jgi:hypothetical protein
MRTLESMGTAGALIPSDVLDAHMLKPLPHVRLMAIDKELQAAAAAGNTSMVRHLLAEKKSIEAAQQRESEQMLAESRARAKAQEIAAPKRGEGALLARRANRLQSQIASKQTQRQKLLARLERDPEDEKLLERIDALARSCEADAERLRTITARQEEIERWEQGRERERERAAKRREFDEKAPRLLARLESSVSEVLDAWKLIDGGLREVEALLTELDDPEMPDPHLAGKVYQRISDATAGAVSCDAVGWKVSAVVRR